MGRPSIISPQHVRDIEEALRLCLTHRVTHCAATWHNLMCAIAARDTIR